MSLAERGGHVQHADAVGVGVVQRRDQGDDLRRRSPRPPDSAHSRRSRSSTGGRRCDGRAEIYPSMTGRTTGARASRSNSRTPRPRSGRAQRCGYRGQVGSRWARSSNICRAATTSRQVGRRVSAMRCGCRRTVSATNASAPLSLHHRPLDSWLVEAESVVTPECSCRPWALVALVHLFEVVVVVTGD